MDLMLRRDLLQTSLQSKAEQIQATDTCDKAGMLTPSQVKRLKGNLIWIAKNTTGMQVMETTFPVQEKHGPNEKPKEKVELVATGPHEKLKQVMNSDVATHNSRLWCGFCTLDALVRMIWLHILMGGRTWETWLFWVQTFTLLAEHRYKRYEETYSIWSCRCLSKHLHNFIRR
ncbi:hypothetical protein RDI58_024559 [Solanum bulbocastanum]|uniref:Uncharacterized protein n=1 Tax=Solanum bulbocastanum TaxID=147425 RepID=A0AAN8T3I1_SOLBU